MGPVHKANTDECGFSLENVGEYSIQRITSDIVVAVSGCSGKTALGNPLFLKCFQNLLRIGKGYFFDL